MSREFDYLVVGAGLFGAVFAYLAHRAGKKVLVVEKGDKVGGHVRTENKDGVIVHSFGPHIFHTNSKEIWDFINSFMEFNRYSYSPIAFYKDKIYHLPLNMNALYDVFGTYKPDDAKRQIEREAKEEKITKDISAETHALLTVGRSVYRTLIQGYIEKEWGRPATTLLPYVLSDLSVDYSFDTPFYKDRYQGVPVEGYSPIIEKMLEGIEVRTNTDFLQDKDNLTSLAEKIVYTGPLDAFFDYKLGALAYRSLVYKTKTIPTTNYQATGVIAYTDKAVPYTRVIEYRHFMAGSCQSDSTVVSWEYPREWRGPQDEPYYPVSDTKNRDLADKYLQQAPANVIFAGRLGTYKYNDMDQTIASAFEIARKEGLLG